MNKLWQGLCKMPQMKQIIYLTILYCISLNTSFGQVIQVPKPNTPSPIRTDTTSVQRLNSSNNVRNTVASDMAILTFSLFGASPQGEFAEVNENNAGFGISGQLYFNPFHNLFNKQKIIKPYLFGIYFEQIWFDRSSSYYNSFINGMPMPIESRLTNAAFSIGLGGRIELFDFPIRPFFEYQAGLRFFNGKHEIRWTNANNEPDKISRTLESHVVGVTGIGGGLSIGNSRVRIDIKMNQQQGGVASYIDPESVEFFTNNTVDYKLKSSSTNINTYHLALLLNF